MIEPSDVTPAEQTPLPSTLSSDPSIVKAAAVLAIGNVVSRILGLLREVVKSNMFGTSDLLAAYTVAALVPMTLFNLISGGEMVSSSLVPVFSDYASERSRPQLWKVLSILLSLAVVLLSLIVLLVEFLAPSIAWLAGARNFTDPDLLPLTVNLMRLATPAVVFLSIASIITGVLLSLKRFSLPAFTTAAFNGIIVVVVLIRPDKITSLIWGLLLGSLLQILMQLPGLRDGKFRFDFQWRHPAIRRILVLYTPIVIGLIVNQIAIWISYNLAIKTGDNSVTYMTYATALYQFPLGLVVTALSLATLPTLSRLASTYQSALADGDLEAANRLTDYKETLANGLRLVISLGIPAAVGLYVLAEPIIALLLEHGAFTSVDTVITAKVLRIYLIGLGFAAVDQMLVFASYARKDTWRPALVGIISIAIYTTIAISLLKSLGLYSLMVADAIKHIVHTIIMLLIFQRQLGGLSGFGIVPSLLKAIAASLVTGVAAYAASYLIAPYIPGEAFLGKLAIVLSAGLSGFGAYLAAVYVLDMKDSKSLWDLLLRRLRSIE